MPGQIVVLMATALIEKEGKYLVLKRSNRNITNKGKWQFPEGKLKLGENLIKGLKREVEEETNLLVTEYKVLGVHSSLFKRSGGIFRLFRTVFKCKVKGRIKISGDHNDYAWISKKGLDKLDFVPEFNLNDIISIKK